MQRQFFSLLVLLLLMTACAGHKHLGNPEAPYPPEKDPQVGDILHLPTGVYVTQEELFDQAGRVQIIYVGETHDNPASHRLQFDILQALTKNNPGKVTLGMEMFTPEQQPALNRWTAGELDEKTFLKEVGWFENWRMNFALYRDLLNFCKENKIPVLALNANKDLQKKVGRVPFEELSAEEQAQLPEMDLHDPYQRSMVEAVFSGHKMGNGVLDGFQRVQTLWDETMSQNIAEFVKMADKNEQIVVVAGGNHVRYGYGIPRRVFRRVPASYILIGSQEIVISEEKQDRLMNVKKPDYPMPPYHLVKFTEYETLKDSGVKLGILLGDEDENGIRVKGLIPGSVAEKVGLEKDDLLIQMDDIELKEAFDLIYELQQKKVGDKIELTLKRGEATLTLPVEFTEAEPKHQNMGMKHGKE
ncbi:ChaN family lipoprotein [Malonomonas rubra]|uniref:ChaN family lipoprotein n=1 Tax=Malonomonas rubra TaxID=57040 RepID=UPI0026F04BF1|nr:ChaN family lipoprotein [Malonomonas rubra]